MPKIVILIDDDVEDLDLMEEAINEVDSTLVCLTFKNSEQAVEHLRKEMIVLPDYVFIDINMPRKTGIECLRDLRLVDRLSSVQIIIYSTCLPEEKSQDLLKAGANFTFQKPYSFQGYLHELTRIFRP